MSTTVAAFKGALYDALAAADLGVQLQYADDPSTAHLERVWLGAVEEGDEDLRGMGAGRPRTMEDYTVHVWVEVIGKPSARLNEERAATIVTAVRDVLSQDPKVGGSVPGLVHALVTASEWDTTETTDGPRTVVDLSVSVKARLV